jgi:hypothetical protein
MNTKKERIFKYYRYLVDKEDFGDGLGNTWLFLKSIDDERGLFLRKIEQLDKNKWEWAKYPSILYWNKMVKKDEK